MDRSVLSVPMLQALGYSLEESQVLLCLLDKGLGTIDELESGTTLVMTVIQDCLQKLQDEGLVELVGREPPTYAVTSKFARESVSQIEKLYKTFITEVEAIVSRKRDELDEIKNAFMSLGYVIKAPLLEPGGRRVPSRLRRAGLTYDFIAESYYRIGVMLLNQERWSFLEEEAPLVVDVTSTLEQHNNCLTSFMMLSPGVARSEKAMRTLDQMQTWGRRWRRERGIEDQAFYALDVSNDMEGQLRSLIREIRQKRKMVESIYAEIKAALEAIDNMISDIESARSLIDFIASKALPFRPSFFQAFGKIAEPIQSIISREMRNHRLFRRQYDEERIRIFRAQDLFESRVYLPNMDSTQDYLERLQALKEKFLPIEYELRQITMPLLSSSQLEEERIKWNPFMFTEPYEPESTTINQEALKRQAQKFVTSIKDGLPGNINFVMGSAGMGKTHMLKYVYMPLLRDNDIWPIYVDCPVKYDLVKSVCQEVLQDRNFPQAVLGHLPSLREKDYSTTLDMTDLIVRINALLVGTHDAKGVVLLLDELENTIPYRYYTAPDVKQRIEEEPLALRQLREILQHDYGERIGFVIAFREEALPMVEQSLRMTNFRAFLREPKQLGLKDIRELALHRYKTWSAKEMRFSDACLKEVIKITEGVTRDIIKYCRELYGYALRKEHKRITRRTLHQIGTIPLFKY